MKNTQARELNVVSAMVSISGIVFQLLLAANMSYLLGNAVLQYSVTIGLFLSGMGIGSYISKYITDRYIYTWFAGNQLVIAFIGGSSTFLLFTLYAYSGFYQLAAYMIILLLGTCVGTELPVLLRMVTGIIGSLKEGSSEVLAWDYLGSLFGSIAVPLVVVPYLGYVRGAFVIGMLNLGIALFIIIRFREHIEKAAGLRLAAFIVSLALLTGISYGDRLAFSMEQKLYRDRIIKTIQTEYQRLTLTKSKEDVRLFIDGNLQFSSTDEYRYHEALVHVPAGFPGPRGRALILGGGDGLAVRELLKYKDVEQITLVDLDPKMVKFAREEPLIRELNEGSLDNQRVEIVYEDAYKFLENNQTLYDLILIDLPDPNNESLNKLYTLEFYALVKNHLRPGGKAALQATSPVFAREVYWTIVNTVRAAGLRALPYHVDIPSFGNWGFVLASENPLDPGDWKLNADTRYLVPGMLNSLTAFGEDEGPVEEEQVNTLLKPVVINQYLEAWRNY